MIAYLLYFLFMTRTTAYRIVSIDISTSLLHQSNFNPSRNLLVTQVFTPRPPCSLRCGPADVYLIVRPILARVECCVSASLLSPLPFLQWVEGGAGAGVLHSRSSSSGLAVSCRAAPPWCCPGPGPGGVITRIVGRG